MTTILSKPIRLDWRLLLRKVVVGYQSHRKPILRSIYVAFFLSIGLRMRSSIKQQKSGERQKQQTSKKKSSEGEINRRFFKRLLRLLRIAIPGVTSREFVLLISQSIVLVIRTLMSLYVAGLDGKLVAALVKGRGKEFLENIAWWMAISVPATYTNSILYYLQCKLALQYRTRLTNYIQDRYLSDSRTAMYYAIHNLDDRIKNADQMISVDVQRFSTSLANLYSNLAKPILDIGIYTWRLSNNIGGEGLLGISLLIQLSANIMSALTPPLGKYVAEEAKLEGNFRFGHSHLIEYSEEIAFLNGDKPEKRYLDTGYLSLIKHVNYVLKKRFYYNVMEDFVIKYVWGALGLTLCSIPVFFPMVSMRPGEDARAALGNRTQSFVTNRRLLISSSDAFGRILFSYKQIAQLVGYTNRVCLLLEVMDDISEGNYQKVLVSGMEKEKSKLLSQSGKVVEADIIKFVDVPIVSPNGDVLVPALSFEVPRGRNLLIVGPNGCGKSSLFRILGGLWPVVGGTLYAPKPENIFYIPQRPYMTRGSLRQQIIYPDTEEEYEDRGATDEDLLEILKVVEIDSLVTSRDMGFDSQEDWRETLSGGVQQRIAMARLFYHCPEYAILDECTSSVGLDIERIMYTHAKELGISLLTVSHRTSLWKYHDLILEFDGLGGYVFSDLDPEKRLALEEEKIKLDAELRAVPEMRERLQELYTSLNQCPIDSALRLSTGDESHEGTN